MAVSDRVLLPHWRASSRVPRTTTLLATSALLGWFTIGSARAATEFWHSKPPAAWSEKEVDRLLTNSPWAHAVEIILPDMSLAGRIGGLQGGRIGGAGGRGRPGAGGGAGGDGAGNLGGGTFLPPPSRAQLIVRWASAWPVKEAIARRHHHRGDERDARATTPLESATDRTYRIVLARIPLTVAVGGDDELRAAASLVGRDGRALRATGVAFAYDDDFQTLEYTFPTDPPLTVASRDVEFKARLGAASIRAKFRLDQMVVDGQPAL